VTDAERIRDVLRRLAERYGPLGWWPGDSPFEIIVGAVLTQRTAWTNVQIALTNLKGAGALTPATMRALPDGELATLIRPSGFYRGKVRKLRAFLELLFGRFGGDLDSLLATPADELRPLLLATHGIGPETADAVLLYAGRRPRFVIDAYTRRAFSRIGIRPERDTYDAWQRLFEDALPPDVEAYAEYHGLIIVHGKDVCRTRPRCGECVLAGVCETGLGWHQVAGDDGVVRNAAADDEEVEHLVVAEDAWERVRPA
jgi:endonuclease-3 related protein